MDNKRKRSASDVIETYDDYLKREYIDIWNEYRYTESDINQMNYLINKYAKPKGKLLKSRSKVKKHEIDNDDKMLGWVSATRTKYYLLHDQAIDWLSMYYDKLGIGPSPPDEKEREENKKLLKDASHIDVLFEGGNVFERKVYEELKDIFKDDFIIVFNEDDMKEYRIQKTIDGMIREKNKYVKELMNQGIPVIAQAPLINDTNKTFGVADILIRSDYLDVLFEIFNPDPDISVKAPLLKMRNQSDSYHYRVIDCKWTTMVLCVDGVTIRNEGFFPAYKGQLAVYTAALESLQGYVPNIAYIMSKAWRIDKANIPESDIHLYKGFSAFDRPGVINYATRDKEYLARTKQAVQWVQKVMTEGREWKYTNAKNKISHEGMYPNMNKSYNPVYDKVKDTLAKRYGDPTMVWYVGTQHRESAHAKGIYDVRDPRCTIEALGIPNTGRGPIIKEILDINRFNQTEDMVRPKIIDNNIFGWKNDNLLDYFVDFETINYNLFVDPYDMDIDNSYFESDVTFMIGFGFNYDPRVNSQKIIDSLCIDKTKCDYIINIDTINGWEFICLHLVNFKLKNELEMYRLFYQFIILRQEIYTRIYKKELESRMFHWTAAEIRFMDRAIKRIRSGEYTKYYMENQKLDTSNKETINTVQNELDRLLDSFDSMVEWIDMCKVFETVPIVVRGSFRFKLKHIGNAFYNNGLIDTHWADGRMSDGFRAMLEAIKLYRLNKPMSKNEEMYKEIIDYNEVDCRVIWEIVNYLRLNH